MSTTTRTNPLLHPTQYAYEAASASVRAIRDAHSASCEEGGPMELLLRDALGDAVKLEVRLREIASFTYSEPE